MAHAGRPALTGIDLTVEAGERVALVGPSGAGNSTLLAICAGSLRPDAGDVEVLGQRLAGLSAGVLRDLRRRIGLIHQRLHLVGRLRVVHNVNSGHLGRWNSWQAISSLVRPRQVETPAPPWPAPASRTNSSPGPINSPAVNSSASPLPGMPPSPDLFRWFSGRTGALLVRLVEDLLPARLPDGGWAEMIARSIETLQMSVVAISLAAVLGLVVCRLAARGGTLLIRRGIGRLVRQLLLLTRAVPPPVWALLVLFVVHPGPLPGALALGIYAFGILGRLFAEVMEDLERRSREALSAIGATPWASFAYATVPGASGQLISYSLYRWEVTARETVIVGLVGAGGLGRLLAQQRVAFDYPGMAGTV